MSKLQQPGGISMEQSTHSALESNTQNTNLLIFLLKGCFCCPQNQQPNTDNSKTWNPSQLILPLMATSCGAEPSLITGTNVFIGFHDSYFLICLDSYDNLY